MLPTHLQEAVKKYEDKLASFGIKPLVTEDTLKQAEKDDFNVLHALARF